MKNKENVFICENIEIPCIFYIIRLTGNGTGYFNIVENTPWDVDSYILSTSKVLEKFNNYNINEFVNIKK